MSYPLVCLGNPLLDLQANVDAAYLAKYALKSNDAILAEDNHLPIYGEVLENDSLYITAGGAAQNAARGAQYVLPENSVVYFGAVGKDVYADKLIEANEKAGLTTRYMVHEDIPTGKCAALISGVDRSLVTELGAANHFKLDHLQKPENLAVVEAAKYFYVGGFHFTVSPPAIQFLAEHAAKENKLFSLNFSAPFIAQFFKDPLDAALPYTDYVIANESEAAAYAESHDLKTTDVKEIAKYVAQLPKVNEKRKRVVVFTQGLDPTISISYDPITKELVEAEYPVRALAAEKIVDTNGAGDAFAGGFLAALVEEKSLEQAIDVGQWLASLSIQEIGPSFPFPKHSYSA